MEDDTSCAIIAKYPTPLYGSTRSCLCNRLASPYVSSYTSPTQTWGGTIWTSDGNRRVHSPVLCCSTFSVQRVRRTWRSHLKEAKMALQVRCPLSTMVSYSPSI